MVMLWNIYIVNKNIHKCLGQHKKIIFRQKIKKYRPTPRFPSQIKKKETKRKQMKCVLRLLVILAFAFIISKYSAINLLL